MRRTIDFSRLGAGKIVAAIDLAFSPDVRLELDKASNVIACDVFTPEGNAWLQRQPVPIGRAYTDVAPSCNGLTIETICL